MSFTFWTGEANLREKMAATGSGSPKSKNQVTGLAELRKAVLSALGQQVQSGFMVGEQALGVIQP